MRIQGAASGSGNNPLGHHVWRYLEGSLKAVMEGIGTKHLPEMNVSNVTTQAEARAESRWCKKFSSVPFIIIVLFNVGLLVYGTFLIPEGPKYTLETKSSYILPNLAAIAGLFVAFWEAQSRWGKLLLITAIELFVFGMFFQLLSLIQITR